MQEKGQGLFSPKRGPIEDRVEIMAERVANGLDIWTGEPLGGSDADDWVRNQDKEGDVKRELNQEEHQELLDAIDWLQERAEAE